MSRADEDMGKPANFESDRAVWRRCRSIEAPEDEAGRCLDLAAFADHLLDEDERDRVAFLLAADPAAAADVAAARAHSPSAGTSSALLQRIITRADALVAEEPGGSGRVLPFRAQAARPLLHRFARWGSLAAAIVVASWLGFAMGSGASLTLSQPGQTSQVGDAAFLPDLLDPATGFLRDLGGSQQT